MSSHDLKLAAWQLRYEQRSFWRTPRAAFFPLAFPLIYILVFGTLTHGVTLDARDGLALIDFYVPGIVTYAMVLTAFNTTALSFAFRRSNGMFKRIRLTPLPWGAYVAGTLASTFVVIAASVTVMLVVGVVAFGAHVRLETLPGLVAALVLGTTCLTTLGVAGSRIVSRPESGGMGILMAVTLPLTFISNIWFPIDGAPAWVQDLGGAFPLKPLADAVATAFDPATAGPGFAGGELLVLGLWTLAGCAMMATTMRALSRRA